MEESDACSWYPRLQDISGAALKWAGHAVQLLLQQQGEIYDKWLAASKKPSVQDTLLVEMLNKGPLALTQVYLAEAKLLLAVQAPSLPTDRHLAHLRQLSPMPKAIADELETLQYLWEATIHGRIREQLELCVQQVQALAATLTPSEDGKIPSSIEELALEKEKSKEKEGKESGSEVEDEDEQLPPMALHDLTPALVVQSSRLQRALAVLLDLSLYWQADPAMALTVSRILRDTYALTEGQSSIAWIQASWYFAQAAMQKNLAGYAASACRQMLAEAGVIWPMDSVQYTLLALRSHLLLQDEKVAESWNRWLEALHLTPAQQKLDGRVNAMRMQLPASLEERQQLFAFHLKEVGDPLHPTALRWQLKVFEHWQKALNAQADALEPEDKSGKKEIEQERMDLLAGIRAQTQLCKSLYGDHPHPVFAHTRMQYALVLHKLGKKATAASDGKIATKMIMDALGRHHEISLTFRVTLLEILKQSNEKEYLLSKQELLGELEEHLGAFHPLTLQVTEKLSEDKTAD